MGSEMCIRDSYRGVFIRYEVLENGEVLLVLDPLIKIVMEDTLREVISREGIEKAKRFLKDRIVLVETLRRTRSGLDLRLSTVRFGILHSDKSAEFSKVVPYNGEMISIKEYYKRLDAEYFLKDVDDDEIIFQAEGSPFHYLVSNARLVVHFDELTRDERRKLKKIIYLSADQRIQLTREFLMLLSVIKDPFLGKLEFEENLYLPEYQEIIEAPRLRFGRLESGDLIEPPNLESPRGYRDFFRGKLIFGPAKRVSIPGNARVAIIYPNDIVEKQAHMFYSALQQESIRTFNVSLPKSLYCWPYSDISDLERIKMNIESFKKNIAGVLCILRHEKDELYLELKRFLKDIPNQMLTLNLLLMPFMDTRRKGIYKNALRNITSGFLGKMGFRPWLLADRLRADFYIGIDTMPGKACIGVVMNSIGDYLVEEQRMIKARMIPRDSMRRLIKDMINESIRRSSEIDKKDLLVVVHRDGDVYREELEGILNSRDDLARSGVHIRYVVISIKKMTPYRIYNLREGLRKYDPCRIGSYVKLDSHRALLASSGSPLLSQGLARPLLIELCYTADEIYDISLAAQESYALSYMHWATITQKTKLPATIKYADDFAYMIWKGIEEELIGPPL